MRWVLLEEVVEIKKKHSARSRGYVPQSEYSAEVLLIEMMAQTGALILGAESDFSKDLVFAKIENASFNHPFESGSSIDIEVSCDGLHDDGGWFAGVIKQGEKVIASARCLLMVVGSFVKEQSKPITFHEAFMSHYRVRDKLITE